MLKFRISGDFIFLAAYDEAFKSLSQYAKDYLYKMGGKNIDLV